MKRIFLILVLLAAAAFIASAKVELAPIFADNMVLQQQTDAALWGKAEPGKKVVITTTWSKAKVTVTADADGKWFARVATPVAGGPYEITFNDGDKLTLKNVLAGEDVVFYPATASVQKDRKVLSVKCPEVPNPVAVRYGMWNWSEATVYNCSGIPVSPFRTDDWK